MDELQSKVPCPPLIPTAKVISSSYPRPIYRSGAEAQPTAFPPVTLLRIEWGISTFAGDQDE